MKTKKLLLAQQFPTLPFAPSADKWLAQATELTIFEQLNGRKITSICVLPLLCTSGLGIDAGEFCIYFNDFCKTEWAFGCIGHEIAHTFHFDLAKNPPEAIIDDQSPEFMYDFDGDGPSGFLIEDFCDEFAKRWLRINTKKKVRLACKEKEGVLKTIILMFSNLRAKEYNK